MPQRRAIPPAMPLVPAVVSLGFWQEGEPPPEAAPLGLRPDVGRTAKDARTAFIEVPLEEIDVRRASRVDWAETCLKLGGTDELCGQAITPGWRVILRADGEEYEVLTVLGADALRFKEK